MCMIVVGIECVSYTIISRLSGFIWSTADLISFALHSPLYFWREC